MKYVKYFVATLLTIVAMAIAAVALGSLWGGPWVHIPAAVAGGFVTGLVLMPRYWEWANS